MADPTIESIVPSDAVLESVTDRAFPFVRAVSCNAGIRAAFARRGYNDAIHQQAWADILKAAGFQKEEQAAQATPESAAAFAQVDAWDEPTFSVARATLAPFPEQYAYVFNNLSAQKGGASVGSVTTFLDRLDDLEKGEGRKATRKKDLAAIAKLAERLIDAKERARMRGLLALAKSFVEAAAPTPEEAEKLAAQKEERRQAKLAVWYYLNEWSEIAKADITRRDYLIQLGLVKRKKRNKGGGGGGEEGGGGAGGAGGEGGGGK